MSGRGRAEGGARGGGGRDVRRGNLQGSGGQFGSRLPARQPDRAPTQGATRGEPKRATRGEPKRATRGGGELAERLAVILDALDRAYPQADCELVYRTPLELLVATILSAQCTDKRVNEVSGELFARYPDARAFAEARLPELEQRIRSTGFFRNKAKSIHGACQVLVDEHGGVVPRSMEDLLRLPGVARKTANVVLGTAYGIAEGIVVDTHVARLAQRLGLSAERQPVKIEGDLMRLVPRSRWIRFAHQMVWHGRRVCLARWPGCATCTLAPHCPSAVTAA